MERRTQTGEDIFHPSNGSLCNRTGIQPMDDVPLPDITDVAV